MSLNVLILSAGIGSRFKSKSKNPKSLIKILDITLIERLLEILIKLKKKNIFITVGFQKDKIIKKLKKYEKKLNIKYIHIKNYKNVGSSFSFYQYSKIWKKNKRDTLFLHSDLFCHENLIKDVISSKHKNIIGSFKKRAKNKGKGWILKFDKKKKIKEIYKKNYKRNEIFHEISCINKFSASYLDKIFFLMNNYFKQISKKDTWEILIDKFIKDNDMNFKSNSSKKSFWYNINTKKDYYQALNYYKNNK